jgi:UDP-N-acetylmuramoyl-tripeptide--D-alanyl-D-alanine ligase
VKRAASGRAAVGCLFRLSEAAVAMGGVLVGRDWKVGNVVTDNREVTGGSLFFSLQGARVDGHEFLRDVFRRGAAGAVVARSRIVPDGPCIEVEDPARALGKLAAWHRGRMPAKVIGVTGSTGKTATKELIVAAMRTVASVHKSEGNLNTEIGIPLALFELCPSHMVSVLEMGMRGPGQIAELCDMTHPAVGVITNIGLSHIGELGSREAIAAAKGELLYALPADGAVVLNADDPFTDQLRVTAPCPVITFGSGGDVEVLSVGVGEDSLDVTFLAFGRHVSAEIRTIGTFQAVNASAALAVAGAMNVDVDKAATGLREAAFPPNRMQLLRFGGVRVLADMYNASPDSVAGALRTLADMPAKRRVAVLGSMLELGEHAREEHERIGEIVARLGIDELGVVGTEAAWIAEAAARASTPMERATRLQTTEAAAEWLPRFVQDGDLILIKGSRALAMERLLDALGTGVG